MSLITMSQNELNRLEAIQKIRAHRLSVIHAAELLHISRSQVHRLLRAYDRAGTEGLVSKKRGRPSNRRHTDDFRNHVLDLVRAHYVDFGPTFACEKLIEQHQVAISKETVRKWMTESRHLEQWKTLFKAATPVLRLGAYSTILRPLGPQSVVNAIYDKALWGQEWGNWQSTRP